MRNLTLSICVASGIALSCGTGFAADLAADYGGSLKDAPASGWVVTLGGYGVAQPNFPGSKDYDFVFQPYGEVHRAGESGGLSLPNDAFGITLYSAGPFRFGAAGNYNWGRHFSDDRSALVGMHKIDSTVELGGFAEYWFSPAFRTRVELLQGVNGDQGFVANFMADFVYRPTPVWQFTIGPRFVAADSQYTSQYYSVTTVEAPLSGLPAYSAGGGLNSVGVEATAKYDLTPRWALRGFLSYNKLVDDAADSPLVTTRGSEDQVRVGFGASYSFIVSPRDLPFK
jgi:MipA family protein